MPAVPVEKLAGRRRRAGWFVTLAAVLLASGCAGTGEKPADAPPTEAQALAGGELAEHRGDYNNALMAYVQALQANANSAEAHFRVARVHGALGNMETAKEAYTRALALQPDHVGALEGLGLVLLEQGRREAANEMLHKAVAKDPQRWRAFNGLGALADLDGKHPLAQGFFKQALAISPDRPAVLNNLGYSYYLAGDYAQAKSYFERTAKAEPGNQHAWSNLGLVETRMGNYEAAVRAFERIMDGPAARYSTAYICMLADKLQVAERLLQEAIRLSPSYYAAAHAALDRVHEQLQGPRTH